MNQPTCIELCAGAGGQAIGLEQAGFRHLALIDIDAHCCRTLRFNRPRWTVIEADIRDIAGHATKFGQPDIVAAGLPCPPFSVAGKQLGQKDERDLFPPAFKIIDELRPKGVMIENVRGFLDNAFESYRAKIRGRLNKLGYEVEWRLLNASDFGVPQLRPRVLIVALQPEYWESFQWPVPHAKEPPTVGEALHDLLASKGWKGADKWKVKANVIAPTIVGGSTKHGGPDLGPTRAKRAWAELGVDGHGVANEPPNPSFRGKPRLTVRMVARLQGFPDAWQFSGTKTSAYRQVGNAFPPPVAEAVARQILESIRPAVRVREAV
ncbi:DNA cytosine methyltransferase [Candidatus Sumerlaeota bacterium]|nr:DNA cytosine methyltransferase [Candidatus Sumerlaeota bacterium]MBI3736269.1 DNA cytosine methyltransferase [Candidatus Sumerlaeota bacterium]